MALPALSPEQRQAALQKAREARAARSDLLAGLKAGTLTLADVLGRDDGLARKTRVAHVPESGSRSRRWAGTRRTAGGGRSLINQPSRNPGSHRNEHEEDP